MMFLLRIAFCLALVCFFFPATQAETSGNEAEIAPAQAFVAAGAAFSDMRQFCTRQPEACAAGSRAALALGQKAQAVAKTAFDFLSTRIGADAAGNAAPLGNGRFAQPNAAERSRSTLTEDDRALPWRGAAGRRSALLAGRVN